MTGSMFLTGINNYASG